MRSIIAFGIVFFVAVMIGYFILKQPKPLPIFQPSDVNPELVDPSLRTKGSDHRVANFKLIDQYGDTITNQNFENSIYVADFFFTRCPTICPIMTSSFARIQEVYKDNEEVKLISHSVTPKIDSVSVLYNYSIKYGAIKNKWFLVTGDKKHIYDLARKSYFAVLDEGDGGLQDFIHTENVVLVDKLGRLRGFYDGTNSEEVGQLIADMQILLKEKHQAN